MPNIDFNQIPKNPGVYIYKNKYDQVIYIGKAKNLKNRVKQYFQKNIDSIKTKYLVKNINSIDYIIVNNEVEALLLENKLIKKHKPKYNINLKDSKTYPYIKITNETIPKITTSRIVNDDGLYFGPFTDSKLRDELISLTVEIFHLITPKTFSSKSKLNFHIGLSPAESLDKINVKEYNYNLKKAIDFLNSKNINKTINKLKNEMNQYSNENLFELALKRKKQIDLIENKFQKQQVDLIKDYDQDLVILNKLKENKISIGIITINKGILSKKQEYFFEEDSEDIFEEFLKMFYSKFPIPKEIILNQKFWNDETDLSIIEEYLSKIKKSKVKITLPLRGEKLSLIKLAEKNFQNINNENIVKEIKDKFKLKSLPLTIECFDISNLGSEHLVGAMTRWKNGIKDQNNYRKFEIKNTVGKNDDFASLREVLFRRYNAILNKKEMNGELPNLIIIDGGLGQFNTAKKILTDLKIYDKVDLISIGKGKKRDKNEIYTKFSNEPLSFNNNSQMMLYVRKIRDSVHEYVIKYNRKKREMKFKKETNI